MKDSTRFYVLLLTFITAVLFLASFAKAEDSYTLYKLPAGHRVSVAGETLQGYNLNEYKQLLTVDSELRAADAQLVLRVQESTKLHLVIDDLQKVNALNTKEVTLLNTDLQRKDLLLSSVAKENVSLHRQVLWRKRLLRVGMGIVSVLAAGLAAGVMIKK